MQNLPTKTDQLPAVFSGNFDEALQKAWANLSIGERALCKSIHRFNQLRSYPLAPEEVFEWKNSLMKLVSKDLSELALQIDFVIDKMMIGQIDYDNKLGIQNIISGLKDIEGENGKYRIRFKW